MKIYRLAILAAAPLLCFGQKREFVELQRDVALLQDQVRSLQSSTNEKMAALTVLVQQALDNINKANTTIAVLDSALRDRMKEQEKTLTGPVAGIGAKVDQMSSEFGYLRETIAELSTRMGKLEQRLVDLGNAVQVMQSPAPPPGAPAQGASMPPAGLSAEVLYANAMRDKDAARYDLALQQFADYLKFYGGTETAPNAQFYIGEIYYNQKQYPAALEAFDLVLEKFPENNKTLDAMYMKGRALFQMGERNQAAEAYREVYRLSPRSELGQKAAQQLKGMGLSTRTPAPASRRKK